MRRGLLLLLLAAGSARAQGRAPVPEAPPRPLYTPAPVYPDSALQAGQEGRVVLRVRVSAEGRVTAAEVVDGRGAAFDSSAVRAVRRWTFRPATAGGVPVAAWVSVPVRFQRTGTSSQQAAPVAVHRLPPPPLRLTMDRRDAAPLRNPGGCRVVAPPVIPAPAALELRDARLRAGDLFRLGLWVLVRGDGSIAETAVDSLEAPFAGDAFVGAVTRALARTPLAAARCDGAVADVWFRARFAYVFRPEGGMIVRPDGRVRRVRPALVYASALIFD